MNFSLGLFVLIFHGLAAAVDPVCALPVGTCAPAPCSFRAQGAGTVTVTTIASIPFSLASPGDACEISGSLYNLNEIPSAGTSFPPWMLIPPQVHELPQNHVIFTYKQWVSTLLSGSPGLCGTADGTVRAAAPILQSELCANGTASSVSAAPPWSWTCADVTTVPCSAVSGPACSWGWVTHVVGAGHVMTDCDVIEPTLVTCDAAHLNQTSVICAYVPGSGSSWPSNRFRCECN